MIAAAAACLGGCARWQPQTSGHVVLTRACPLARAPNVADFGRAGLRGVYHFVTQDASSDELGALVRNTEAAGFNLMLLTVNLNGKDTVFARGPAVLRNQRDVDAEFGAACRMGQGHVYLTHVRYNPAGEAGDVRVR
jgi:hypothetical protein